MAREQKKRVVELQRQVKIARDALERIAHGCVSPYTVASVALDKMWPLDRKQQLQGLVGHEPR